MNSSKAERSMLATAQKILKDLSSTSKLMRKAAILELTKVDLRAVSHIINKSSLKDRLRLENEFIFLLQGAATSTNGGENYLDTKLKILRRKERGIDVFNATEALDKTLTSADRTESLFYFVKLKKLRYEKYQVKKFTKKNLSDVKKFHWLDELVPDPAESFIWFNLRGSVEEKTTKSGKKVVIRVSRNHSRGQKKKLKRRGAICLHFPRPMNHDQNRGNELLAGFKSQQTGKGEGLSASKKKPGSFKIHRKSRGSFSRGYSNKRRRKKSGVFRNNRSQFEVSRETRDEINRPANGRVGSCTLQKGFRINSLSTYQKTPTNLQENNDSNKRYKINCKLLENKKSPNFFKMFKSKKRRHRGKKNSFKHSRGSLGKKPSPISHYIFDFFNNSISSEIEKEFGSTLGSHLDTSLAHRNPNNLGLDENSSC